MNDLQYYGIRIYNVTSFAQTLMYSQEETTHPSGGTIAVNLNTSGSVTKWLVQIYFKRAAYAEWNTTYSYFGSTLPIMPVANWSYPTNIIPNMLGNFSAGNLGPTTKAGMGLVAIFIALVAGLAASKAAQTFGYPTSIGGSAAFILVLVFFALYGVFDLALLLLMGLAAIGINLARYI
jgi:hypothetical protein